MMNRALAVQTVRLTTSKRHCGQLLVTRPFKVCSQPHSRFTHQTPRLFQVINASRSRNVMYLVAFGAGIFGAGLSLKNYVQCEAAEVLNETKERTLADVIKESQGLIQQVKDEMGCPGIVVSVSVDGKEVWSQGFGYADLENRVPCDPDTVMRVASISKSITMTMVAKLWEQGKLDLDKPVREYVKAWPHKTYKDEKVSITTRQLVSHLAGVRHYTRDCGRKDTKVDKVTTQDNKQQNESKTEYDMKEYHIKEKYKTMADSLKLFKEDELCFKPGSGFLYSTHGWSLVGAVLEVVSNKKFTELSKTLFTELGLQNTYLDENEPIIYNRARYYIRNKTGRVINAPHTDNSWKFPGGGFLSTARDLCIYGNTMLYCYQATSGGYLATSTLRSLWSPVELTECSWDKTGAYGMGWGVVPERQVGGGRHYPFYVSHTGGAVGGSSVLLIMPSHGMDENNRKCKETENTKTDGQSTQYSNTPGDTKVGQCSSSLPCGIVVSILTNMQAVGLNKTALAIANKFSELKV